MTLLVLAYPEFADADVAWIQEIRRVHDPQCDMIAPHLTLVYGTEDADEGAIADHVAGVAAWFSAVPFRIRRAFIDTDNADNEAFFHLVPEDGYETLYALHERLNEGPLSAARSSDFPYVPHITLGRGADVEQGTTLIGGLNKSGIDISGRIAALTVVRIDDLDLQDIRSVDLAS